MKGGYGFRVWQQPRRLQKKGVGRVLVGAWSRPRLGSQGDDHRVHGGYGPGATVNATPTKSPALAGPEEQRER